MPDPQPQTAPMSPEAFGQMVKAKYPQYAGIPDAELASKVALKHPEYANRIDWKSAPPTQPNTYKPPTPSPMGQAIEKYGRKIADAAPAILGTVGGIAGGLSPVPGGAIMGAAYGGGVGEAARRKAEGFPVSHKAEIGQAALQGGLEATGVGSAKLIEKVGGKLASKALSNIYNLIGLTPSSLPKFGRTVETAEDVARTVAEKAGIKGSSREQVAAIEAARQQAEQATGRIVQTPMARTQDVHAIAYDNAVELLDEMEKEGATADQLRAIDKNLEGVINGYRGARMTPDQMLSMRRGLQKAIKDFGDPKTVQDRFLVKMYHDLNDAIEQALPAPEARAFREQNRIQNRLIIARDSATAKVLSDATKAQPGLTSTAVKAGIGAAGGGLIGSEYGHGREGALAGALLGAATGAVPEMPGADRMLLSAGEKIAPKLAALARSSPYFARLLQALISQQGASQQTSSQSVK